MNPIQDLKSSIDHLDLTMSRATISDLSVEVNQLINAGGKKFRPGLLFLMGQVFSIPMEKLQIYARAAELTHLASLIHDDVIDESDKRRNHTTLNALKNNTTAILAGDYVLASIMGELARANNPELLIDLTECIQDLADGEWLQYNLKHKELVSFKDLELISIKKTGSLIRFCCTTPAKLAGHTDITTLATLGERIGLLFQMADDIVDGKNQSGRAVFQDILNGQFNYVTLKILELFPELTDQIYDVKNAKTKVIPWNQNQYHQAVLAVHETINLEKEKLVLIFKNLCTQYDKLELVDIFSMTLSKIQVNYASQLES